MAIFNGEKFTQSFRIGLKEAKILAPVFFLITIATTLAKFVFTFLLGMLFGVLFGKTGVTEHQTALSLILLPLEVVAFCANIILLYSAVRARSLGIPLRAGWLWGRLKEGLLPVARWLWAMLWRSFLWGFAGGFLLALLHKAGVSQFLTVLLGAVGLIALVYYYLPLGFTVFFRIFHPGMAFADAQGRMQRQTAHRRTEILLTWLAVCLAATLPLLMIVGIMAAAFGKAGASIALILIYVPLVPMAVVNYLFYEEFELAEGLHPPTHADQPELPFGPL